MKGKQEPSRAIGLAIGEMFMVQGGGGQGAAENLTLYYYHSPGPEDSLVHVLMAGRDDGKEMTRLQEERVLASLLLALRNVSRGGSLVVTIYPARDQYRTTVSGRLCAVWRWQSVSPARLFELDPNRHQTAARWLAAVDELAAHDRSFSQPTPTLSQPNLL